MLKILMDLIPLIEKTKQSNHHPYVAAEFIKLFADNYKMIEETDDDMFDAIAGAVGSYLDPFNEEDKDVILNNLIDIINKYIKNNPPTKY